MVVYEGNDQRFKAFCSPETFEKIVDYKSVQDLFRHCTTEYADRTETPFWESTLLSFSALVSH